MTVSLVEINQYDVLQRTVIRRFNVQTMNIVLHAVSLYFIFMQIKVIFKNGFALRLALKQRHKGTRKWPLMHVNFAADCIP